MLACSFYSISFPAFFFQKQYERFLLSLCNRRQPEIDPASYMNTTTQFPSPFVTKHDKSTVYQSSYYDRDSRYNPSRLSYYNNALLPSATVASHANYPHRHPNIHNQSFLRDMPSVVVENSINRSNYRTTGADIEPPQLFSSYLFYPSSMGSSSNQATGFDDLAQIPQYQQSVGKKSFHRNDSAIKNHDMNLPTTINSIYSQQRYNAPQFDEKSAAKTFHPIYHANNQPLENHNYNSENLKMSETFNGKSLIIPTPSGASTLVTQLSPQPTRGVLSAPPPLSSEMLLLVKNHSVVSNIHMSDGDAESDDEKCNATSKRNNIRRSDFVSDDTFRHQIETKGGGDKATSFRKHDDFIDNLQQANVKLTQEKTNPQVDGEFQETRSSIDGSTQNENVHQVWEKIADETMQPTDSSYFVIPKIIVETQIDLTEATLTTAKLMDDTMIENQDSIQQKREQLRAMPEMSLNHQTGKQSGEARQQSESLSFQALTVNNNSPLDEATSSIYHYDKQPIPDEQQQEQQNQHRPLRVEHEFQSSSSSKKFEISQQSLGKNAAKTEAIRAMTYESEIKTNNSLAKGNSVVDIADDEGGLSGGGIDERK